MNNMKNPLVISGVIALVISLAVVFTVGGRQGPAGNSGSNGSNGANGSDGQVGSLAGPDIPFPYLRWGGLGPIWNSASAPAATTTSSVFCSIAVPTGTSTIAFASWRPDAVNGFGTGQVFDISTSTTVAGSSTPALAANLSFSTSQVWQPDASNTYVGGQSQYVLGQTSNVDGAQNVFTVVSSPTGAAGPLYLNFRVATPTPGTFSSYPTGNCQVQFVQL